VVLTLTATSVNAVPPPISLDTPYLIEGPFPQAAEANMLSLDLFSANMSGDKVLLQILAPDTDNAFQITFNVEWRGLNRIQLEKVAFENPRNGPANVVHLNLSNYTVDGTVGAPSWDDVQAVQLSLYEPGPLPPTRLRLDRLVWSAESPAWELEHGEWMIEPSYSWQFGPDSRWQPVEGATEDQIAHKSRRWNCAQFTFERPPGQPIDATYWRRFNLDISDSQALRCVIAVPGTSTFGFSALIDGQMQEILSPQPGHDDNYEYRAQISGQRLEALYLHFADSPSTGKPVQGSESVSFLLHFITMESNDFQAPEYPARLPTKPLPEGLVAREPLLEKGVPAWLYFGREDIPQLRNRVRSGERGMTWEGVLAAADRHLGQDPSPLAEGYYPRRNYENSRPWTISTNISRAAYDCAFAYILSEDMRYAEQARRYLKAAASFQKWNYGMISKYPVGWGGHAGPFCEADAGNTLAMAYNWIYNTLTGEERRTIEEAILFKSWFWLNDYVDTMEYIKYMNQGPHFTRGAVLQAALLSALSYPQLKSQLSKYADNLQQFIELGFLEDGSNTEGAGYWGLTLNGVVHAYPLLAHELGQTVESLVPQRMRTTIEVPVYLRSLASADFRVLSINDGGYGGWRPGIVGLFLATFLDDPIARWLLAAEVAAAGRPSSSGSLQHLLWYEDLGDVSKPELALARRFDGCVGTVMRSRWEAGGLLLNMQTGVWARPAGHQHDDKNSIIVEGYGQRLCFDYGSGSYGSASELVYGSTPYHNAISMDGGDQIRAGNPVVRVFEHTETYDYVESDAAACYPGASQVLRRVLFRRPTYFVISDEIALEKPASIAFNLHSPTTITLEGDEAYFTGEQADMLVKILHPHTFDGTVSTLPTAHQNATAHWLQLTPPEPLANQHYLTVLYPLEKDMSRPEISVSQPSQGTLMIAVDDDRIAWDAEQGLRLE
jgi:hypothetical protein